MTDSHQGLARHHRALGPIVLVLGLTIVTGSVHGYLTQRWGPAPNLLVAASQLEDFPHQIGDWQLLSEDPMEEATVRMLSCAGYVNRRYMNYKSGTVVSIAIMLGPSGPISVHTPEVCYSSRAYSVQEKRKEISLPDADGKTHTFWSLAFLSNTRSTDQLRVCYAWYGDSAWEASTFPRFQFAGRPSLWKLQVSTLAPTAFGSQARDAQDPCQEFLSAMLRSGWSISG